MQDPGAKDTIDRVESDWPVPETKPKTLYLQTDKTLTESAASGETKLTYEVSSRPGGIELTYKVPETLEFLGYAKVRLWVEAIGSNDMELTVAVVKRGPDGKAYPGSPFGEAAAAGLLRVSHCALDKGKSTDYEPYHTHVREELLKEGEIVPVDIGL
jgi:predicted acyl esterase